MHLSMVTFASVYSVFFAVTDEEGLREFVEAHKFQALKFIALS